jgi:hypothetical protein
MTKQFILPGFFYFLFTSTVFGQPVLTSSGILPHEGDQFTYYSTEVLSRGASGAGITWDFSNLQATDTIQLKWFNKSESAYKDSFPNAELTAETNFGIDFIKTSGGDYQRQGLVIEDFGIVTEYQDPEDFIRLPMAYSDQYEDSFSSVYNSFLGKTIRKGTLTVNADAYGTLILPYAAINNVLRISYHEDISDSTIFNTVPSTLEIISWYSNKINAPLLTYFKLSSAVYGETETMQYLNQESYLIAGIPKNERIVEIKVYPVPCNKYIYVSGIKRKRVHLIEIVDMQGKILRKIMTPKGNQAKINVADFEKGTYIMNLHLMDGVYSKIIIKTDQP